MNASYRADSDDDSDNEGFGDDAPMMADAPIDYGGDAGDVQDFFTGDQAVTDDFGGGMDDMGMGLDGDHDHDGGPAGEDSQYAQEGRHPVDGPSEPFDARRAPNERDLVLAMTEGGGGMFDYFDQTFRKNWAGPEHWKLRKVIRRRE
jgi:condensin complex subunit 2